MGDGLSWATAKQTIQAAVDLAQPGDTVWVTNGVYNAGGAVAPVYVDSYSDSETNSLMNRVCITKAVTVRSVNGAETTIIQGSSAAVRCAYLCPGAVLEGFTLTGGYTARDSDGGFFDHFGGGAFLVTNAVLSHCILNGNGAFYEGGGAFCLEGGTLNNCLLNGNIAGYCGGGVSLWNGGTLNNCTVSGNSATNNEWNRGSGVYADRSVLNNCIIWGNNGGSNNIYSESAVILYTCASPLPSGDGNICADPLFKNPLSNFRLKQGSPCIDAGSNETAMTNDLDGVSRPVNMTGDGTAVADMGCYELSEATLPKTYYVDASRLDDLGDGLSWATAKKTVQAAVDLATDEDTVLVTNGVYDAGGTIAPPFVDPFSYEGEFVASTLTNRVCITKAITVQSVNGPEVTVIQGGGEPGAVLTMRCAYLCPGAVLNGFTLTGGYTAQGDGGELLDRFGGGAFIVMNAVMNNCILSGNGAWYEGGGAFCLDGGALNNCLLNGNIAGYCGGGVSLWNGGTLNNCTVSGNSATNNEWNRGSGVYADRSVLNNCIIWGNNGGSNNIYSESAVILYTCASPLPSGDGNICADPLFKNPLSNFRLKQGSPCIDAGSNDYAPINDLDSVARPVDGDSNGSAVADMGCYELSETTLPKTYYVDASRLDDTGDGLSWATAMKVIQSAVDLATDEDTVLVTNGVYDAGGMVVPIYTYPGGYSVTNSLTNRVCITKAVTVRSVNGPDMTVIQGASNNGTNGPAAVRCVYLYSGAVMTGFTLTGGHTLTRADNEMDMFGGGALLLTNSTLNNCIVEKNSAHFAGGGVYAERGGGVLNNCLITENTGAWDGGGVYLMRGTMNNCTVCGNDAEYAGGGVSLYEAVMNNCIVFGNTSSYSSNINQWASSDINYTCSSPLPEGEGNICADPLFVDSVNSNFQLQVSSPCVNAGQNCYVTGTNDLGGSPRVVGGVVDIGTYENQDVGTDADNDGMNDLWEFERFGGRHFAEPSTICSNGVNTLREAYISGLDPKDPNSKFEMTMFPGRNLQWAGVSGRVYSVYYSTNLLDGFFPLKTNIPWTAGSFTDDVHNANGQMYYKIGVELAP